MFYSKYSFNFLGEITDLSKYEARKSYAWRSQMVTCHPEGMV